MKFKLVRAHALSAVFALSCAVSSAFAQTAPASDPSFQRLSSKYTVKGNEGWSGNLGLGVTFTRGNSESEQISGTFDAVRVAPEDRLLFHGLIVRNRTQDGVQADNSNGLARYERNVSASWFGFGQAELERDVLRDLALRQSYGGGAGYRLFQTDRNQLNAYAGLAYTLIDNRTTNDSNGVEFFVGNDWVYKLTDTSSFTQRFIYYPDTVDTNGGRYVLEASLNTKVYGALGLQLSMQQKYQDKVPAGRKSSDTVLFTGLTIGF